MNPFQLFKQWYDEEYTLTKVRIPAACCLSTIGLDGFPNARFISLKEVIEETFVVTGPLTSRKDLEIEKSNKVSLVFWWTETERQVRIQGEAASISDKLADKYFVARGVDAQIVSTVSEQGKEIRDLDTLNKQYQETERLFKNKAIARPSNWAGYSITPVRMEFMEFSATRFHDRKLYEVMNGKWIVKQIQP
jgi:pyridoxamine 5'-phosphate oxidase